MIPYHEVSHDHIWLAGVGAKTHYVFNLGDETKRLRTLCGRTLQYASGIQDKQCPACTVRPYRRDSIQQGDVARHAILANDAEKTRPFASKKFIVISLYYREHDGTQQWTISEWASISEKHSLHYATEIKPATNYGTLHAAIVAYEQTVALHRQHGYEITGYVERPQTIVPNGRFLLKEDLNVILNAEQPAKATDPTPYLNPEYVALPIPRDCSLVRITVRFGKPDPLDDPQATEIARMLGKEIGGHFSVVAYREKDHLVVVDFDDDTSHALEYSGRLRRFAQLVGGERPPISIIRPLSDEKNKQDAIARLGRKELAEIRFRTTRGLNDLEEIALAPN